MTQMDEEGGERFAEFEENQCSDTRTQLRRQKQGEKGFYSKPWLMFG